MKRAFFILAVLFLFTPLISMGQDFEVVSPVSKKITFKALDGEILYDSSIIVRNIDDSMHTISAFITPSSSLFRIFGNEAVGQIPLKAGQSMTLPLRFYSTSVGGYLRSYMRVSDSSFVDTVVVETTSILHIIDTNGRDGKVYFHNIKVGEKVCTPLKARNYTDKPINIYKIGEYTLSDTNISMDTLISLPYVLLPGEDITVANLCYKPSKINESFNIYYIVNSSLSSNTRIFLYANSTVAVDTILAKPCIQLSQENPIIGPVLFEGDTTHTLFFKSNRYDTIIVNDVVFYGGDGLLFNMVKPLPDTIAPLSLTPVKVRFSPTTLLPVVKDRFAVDARFNTSCGEFSIDLSALAMQPTADSIATPLFPDKEYILGMSASAPSFSQDFHFVNNGLTNVKIVSVGLADPSPEFAITGIQPTSTLPFTLAPGEKMSVSVLFTPSQTGKVFFNQLLITTDQGLQSLSYPLQALRTTTSGVKESSDPSVSVSLVPNPATTSVTVKVEGAGVIDEATMNNTMGNMVLLATRPKAEWSWELKPDFIARGTYFIRVTGKTTDGKPFVASRRLVVE